MHSSVRRFWFPLCLSLFLCACGDDGGKPVTEASLQGHWLLVKQKLGVVERAAPEEKTLVLTFRGNQVDVFYTEPGRPSETGSYRLEGNLMSVTGGKMDGRIVTLTDSLLVLSPPSRSDSSVHLRRMNDVEMKAFIKKHRP